MNISTKTECKTIGWGFLIVATIIEFMLLCALFNTFAEGLLKITMVGTTLIIFNVATWFFATKYDQTLHTLNKK